MEERDFFNELCVSALCADRNVRFTGVMDDCGRLLAGKYHKDIRSSLVLSSGEPDTRSSLFYASYQSVMQTRSFASALGSLRYQLSEYDNAKLLTVPMTNRNDRFLCISIDLARSCHRTVSRLLERI